MRALEQSKHCMVKDGALLGLPVIRQLLEHLFRKRCALTPGRNNFGFGNKCHPAVQHYGNDAPAPVIENLTSLPLEGLLYGRDIKKYGFQMGRLRIAFLASNNGSSFRAVNEAIQSKLLDAKPVVLISNKADTSALDYAQENGIPSVYIPTKDIEDAADRRLRETLLEHHAELIVLSGYLRKLGPLTLDAFDGRILNVHPGLLPKYGGLGMYGRKVHQAVLDNEEASTGATIHLVDGEYDHGRTIAATIVPIGPSDDVTSLERRVMSAECDLFIDIVRRIIQGELHLPL